VTSINDPRKGYNARTGKVEEFSLRPRPQTSNADEWMLWLEQHAEYGIEFKAVQIAEALDSMHRGAFRAALNEALELARSQVAHYEALIERGKGVHGEPSYIRDDTWNSWNGSLRQARYFLSCLTDIQDAATERGAS
jgi:hypothetical protein